MSTAVKTPVILGICGPSSAGKSHLSTALVERLGAGVAARVPGDYFLVPAQVALDAFLTQPLQYDWALMEQRLDGPAGRSVETPRFDFTTFTRRVDAGSRTFPIHPVMIIDAMYPCPFADLQVFVTASASTRSERIGQRDRSWHTNVLARWEQLELSRRHLEAMAAAHALAVSGEDPVLENVDRIAQLLREPMM